MPRYDYHCPKCGLDFELRRSISEASDPASCPNDGAVAERVFTMPMTFVKGGAGAPPSESPGAGAHDHGHGHDHGHTHGPGGHSH